jgi:hypothetical protein
MNSTIKQTNTVTQRKNTVTQKMHHDIEESNNIEHTTQNTKYNPDQVKKPCVKLYKNIKLN